MVILVKQKDQKINKKSPLTKKQIEEESSSDELVEELKPKIDKRTKKERSEKQLQHTENMRKKRFENIEKAKLNKKIEASKILLENDVKPKKKIIKEPESESEEEVIIIEKKKKPKKKTKRIIIEESSSDEEEEDEKEEEKRAPNRPFKSQQNKKSIIKINGVDNSEVKNNSIKDFSKFFV